MKLFVDTSALAAFYTGEAGGEDVEDHLLRANTIILSELSTVEMASALARKVRMKELNIPLRDKIWELFQRDILAENIQITRLGPATSSQATALINKYGDIYSLRSLDALQLASAILSGANQFLSLDQTLNTIASKIGFKTL